MKEKTVEYQTEIDITKPGTTVIVEESISVVQLPERSSSDQNQQKLIHTSRKPELHDV